MSRRLDRRSVTMRTQAVLSLVELMIAVVIGLFLIAGAITVYLQSGSAYKTADKIARLQETGRYAMEVMEPDIRMAGMWGITNRTDAGAITNTVAAASIAPNCGANWIAEVDTSGGGEGFLKYVDARDDGDLSTVAACNSATRIAGSDTLILRRADVETSAVNQYAVQIQSTRIAATIFKASSLPLDPAETSTHNLVVRAYYVTRPTSGAFAGQPVLVRRSLGAGTVLATEATFNEEDVIPGVEDFQVQFGVDDNGDDNAADRYVNPGSVPAGKRVVSVRIWIMLVSEEVEANLNDPAAYAYANRTFSAFTDKKRRVVMTKTIQLRNARVI